MADIIDLEAVRKGRADDALDAAHGLFASIVIVGYDDKDELIYLTGGNIDDAGILFLFEQVKLHILMGDFDE
jgi:hypothetical protein